MSKRHSFKAKVDRLIFVLSVYVLLQLAVESLVDFPDRIERLLSIIDFVVCLVFLVDWSVSFWVADRKLHFFLLRLPDLLGSIPLVRVLRPLRILRVARLARAFRLLRALRTSGPLFRYLLSNPRRSALFVYRALTTLIYVYCSFAFYEFESPTNESVATVGDAFWMAFTTLTTVRYGDIYPVTTAGRLVAAVLVVVGLGLFSLATAEIASVLMKALPQTKESDNDVGSSVEGNDGWDQDRNA